MAGEHGYRALTVLYHRVCDKGEEVFALGRIYREIRIQPSGEALVKLVEHGIAECPAVHRHRHVSGQGSVALAVLGEGDDLSVLFNVRALHNVREQAVLDLTDTARNVARFRHRVPELVGDHRMLRAGALL